jgi:hypothetical protein
MDGRLSDRRLEQMLAESREWLARFTDPPTATIELRAVEVIAALAELVERRRGAGHA